jgi:hypothetical protein
MTNPRCHLEGSGDDDDDLEGHLAPRKAARTERERQAAP